MQVHEICWVHKVLVTHITVVCAVTHTQWQLVADGSNDRSAFATQVNCLPVGTAQHPVRPECLVAALLQPQMALLLRLQKLSKCTATVRKPLALHYLALVYLRKPFKSTDTSLHEVKQYSTETGLKDSITLNEKKNCITFFQCNLPWLQIHFLHLRVPQSHREHLHWNSFNTAMTFFLVSSTS